MENKHSYARCSTWCKDIQNRNSRLLNCSNSVSSREGRPFLFQVAWYMHEEYSYLVQNIQRKARQISYSPLFCEFITINNHVLTTYLPSNKDSTKCCVGRKIFSRNMKTLFSKHMEYIYIHNITFQVKRGMTKKQYFDFT